MKQGRVVTEHKSTFPKPLIAATGDTVRVGKRDDEYQGWLWCTDKDGISAWVPESYLRIDGALGEFVNDYDSYELSVGSGELLEIIEEIGGWCWCVRNNGETGWLPADKLEVF
jgi:SH3-like domain-containing protein